MCNIRIIFLRLTRAAETIERGLAQDLCYTVQEISELQVSMYVRVVHLYLLANIHDGIIPSPTDQRRVRLDNDAMLLAVLHNVFLLAEWVKLTGP